MTNLLVFTLPAHKLLTVCSGKVNKFTYDRTTIDIDVIGVKTKTMRKIKNNLKII
jgi:hypothetical protein